MTPHLRPKGRPSPHRQKHTSPCFCSPKETPFRGLQVEAFIFDCDGVIWRGDSLIEGVPETLSMLRRAGKKVIFVTNNSTKSRAGYKAKFTKLGLEVDAAEIYSSSFAAAAYLHANNFDKSKKVRRCLGSRPLVHHPPAGGQR